MRAIGWLTTGVFLLGLALGSITLVSGCDSSSGGGDGEIAKPVVPSEQEKQERMKLMEKMKRKGG